jgi:AsmA protein
VSAKDPEGELKAKLDVPALTLTSDKVAGEKLTLDATRSSGKNRLMAKVTVAGVQGTFKALQAGPLDAHIETLGERTMKAHLTGSISANMEAKSLQTPNLKLVANITDAKLAKGAIDADVSASARADFTRQTAALEFSGKLDESQVNGTATVRKFSPLAMTFDVNADQLNVDRLMGKSSSSPSEKIDLSALEGLNLIGAIKVDKLTFMNLRSSQVRADIKVANGRLDVAPLSAKLYDGALNGSISAQAAPMPAVSIKQALSGVNLGPLLRDAAQIDTLQGKGSVNVDVTARGASVDALKKALNGSAAINIADGAIKGFDIAGTLRGARSKLQQLRGEQVQQSNKAAATDFSEMKATFNVKNGVAHNDDLTMKSPLLRVTGAGDIDIGRDSMNYLLKATVVATSKGQGGKELADLSGLTVPVKLSGALESPQYAVDFGGMATEFAKHQLKDEVLRRAGLQSSSGTAPPKVTKVEDVVKGLKGFFKK